MTFGSGSVWVAEFEDDRVLRIDPDSGRVIATIRLSLPRPISGTPDGSAFLPFDIAAGGGFVWVSTARGSLARIDPRTNRVVEQFPVPLASNAILTISSGAVWLAGDLNGLLRIDSDTGRQKIVPIESPDGSRLSVTSLASGGGSVYVTGVWAVAMKRGQGYVSTDRAALVELNARRGKVGHILPLPTAMTATPSSGVSVWLSPWISRSAYSLRPGAADIGPAMRLPRPGHLLAAVGDGLWVEDTNQTLARYPIGGRE